PKLGAIARPGGLIRGFAGHLSAGNIRVNFAAIEVINLRAAGATAAAHTTTTAGSAATSIAAAGRGLSAGRLLVNGDGLAILRDGPYDAVGVLHSWGQAGALRLIQRPGAGKIGHECRTPTASYGPSRRMARPS